MQSIAGTLQSGNQAADTTPKPATDLVTELMNAHFAKGNGDVSGQEAALLRAEMAAKGDLLKEQKKNVEEQIKLKEKLHEQALQLVEMGQSHWLKNAYVAAVKDKDYTTVDYLAAIIKDIDPDLYNKTKDFREAASSSTPETAKLALLGASDDVQSSSFATELEMTPKQIRQQERTTGKAQTPEQRAIQMNEEIDSNVDPAAAFMRDTTEKPEQKTPEETTEQELGAKTNIIDALEKPAGMKDEEWEAWKNQQKAEIAGGKTSPRILQKEPSPGSITDTQRAEEIFNKYKDDFSNNYMIRKIGSMMPVGNRKAWAHDIDSFLRGRTFEQMASDPQNKKAVAFLAADEIFENAPGGEIAKRNLLAREILQVHLPEIQKRIDLLQSQGKDLGKLTAFVEAIARRTGGDIIPNDPEVASLFSDIKFLVTEFIALRSGAQVTESEREMYTQIFAQIGNDYKLNTAIIDGLMTNVLRGLKDTFVKNMGEDWGNYTTNLKFDLGEVAPQEYIRYISQAQFDGMFEEMKERRPGTTAQEFIDSLRRKRTLIR